jgi:hypothetical protein
MSKEKVYNGCFFKFGVEVGVELSIVNTLYRLRIMDQLFKSYAFTRVVRSRSTLQRLLPRQIKKKHPLHDIIQGSRREKPNTNYLTSVLIKRHYHCQWTTHTISSRVFSQCLSQWRRTQLLARNLFQSEFQFPDLDSTV